MGHLVPGGTETGQNEGYQMSTILRNGTIAPKNSQYPSVQEKYWPPKWCHNQPYSHHRHTGPRANAVSSGAVSQLPSWTAGMGPLQRAKRTSLLPRRPGRQSTQSHRLGLFWLVAFFLWGCLGLNLGPYVLYHIISHWATPQPQGVILTLKSNRIWISCL